MSSIIKPPDEQVIQAIRGLCKLRYGSISLAERQELDDIIAQLRDVAREMQHRQTTLPD